MFRRGTASCLEALGIDKHVLNRDMGWSAKSSMLETYRRNVQLARLDAEFFYDVVQQNKSPLLS